MDDFSDFRFTEDDLWVRVEGELWVVGITDYAQSKLGDIISVDLPEPDDHSYDAGEEIGMLESLSKTMEIISPVDGVIVESNTTLLSSPELVSTDPFEAGWIFKIKPDNPDAFDELMDVNEYEAMLPEEDDE